MRRLIMLAMLLLLVGCGSTAQTLPSPTSLPSATPVPSPTPLPSATPASPATTPTFVAIIVDITAPPSAVPTAAANAPLVVTPTFPQTEIVVGTIPMQVELASTPSQRQQGLMYRDALAANDGMLFVFPFDQQLSFWMRNTKIPLSIAFIDSTGVIVDIQDMQPLDDQNFHLSPGPVRYALEVNQGWFGQNGIAVGDTVTLNLPSDLVIQ
jgi:uncharacterized membrane protein (UPF0127 family)